jgi:hypothetical protein
MLCASNALRVAQHTSLVGKPVTPVLRCSIARIARLTRIEKSPAEIGAGSTSELPKRNAAHDSDAGTKLAAREHAQENRYKRQRLESQCDTSRHP